jgi:hypothetical protein
MFVVDVPIKGTVREREKEGVDKEAYTIYGYNDFYHASFKSDGI